jgi:PhnB protein
MSVSHIPKGYQTAIPYLMLNEAARAIEFYCEVYGATEMFRMPQPDGKIAHAEIKLGDSVIMLGDEFPGAACRAPGAYGGTPVGICVYLKDCDTVVAKAVARGAKIIRPLQDQFYGDRSATLVDPFGHCWTISTHIEDVTPEEIEKRLAAMQGKK